MHVLRSSSFVALGLLFAVASPDLRAQLEAPADRLDRVEEEIAKLEDEIAKLRADAKKAKKEEPAPEAPAAAELDLRQVVHRRRAAGCAVQADLRTIGGRDLYPYVLEPGGSEFGCGSCGGGASPSGVECVAATEREPGDRLRRQ